MEKCCVLPVHGRGPYIYLARKYRTLSKVFTNNTIFTNNTNIH